MYLNLHNLTQHLLTHNRQRRSVKISAYPTGMDNSTCFDQLLVYYKW